MRLFILVTNETNARINHQKTHIPRHSAADRRCEVQILLNKSRAYQVILFVHEESLA